MDQVQQHQYFQTKKDMKIVKSLEKSGLLIRAIRETIKNEAKEQTDRFLRMLLGTLVYSLSALTGRRVIKASEGILCNGA